MRYAIIFYIIPTISNEKLFHSEIHNIFIPNNEIRLKIWKSKMSVLFLEVELSYKASFIQLLNEMKIKFSKLGIYFKDHMGHRRH
jgi:hypothetical protein